MNFKGKLVPQLIPNIVEKLVGAKPLHNYQEAALTFTLGFLNLEDIIYNEDGSATWLQEKSTRVEQHSTINGYHVRTIPGSRWTNPVIVAAGAGLIAVVDRAENQDFIRVTDKYGGTSSDKSEDPLAFPDFDWSTIADLAILAMPPGFFVTGVQITDREVLVVSLASVTGWSTDPTTYFYSYDMKGYAPWGNIPAPSLEELVVLPQAVWCGPLLGRPTLINAANVEDMLLVALTASTSDNSAYLLIYDVLNNAPFFGRSLPFGYHPVSITACQSIISVLCRTERPSSPAGDPISAADPLSEAIYFRFFLEDPYGLYARPPFGKDGGVTKSFEGRDPVPLKDIRFTDKNPLTPETGQTVVGLPEYEDALTERRNLFTDFSRYSRNLNRSASVVYLQVKETSPSGEQRDVMHTFQQVTIPMPPNTFLLDADCSGNQTTETYRARTSPGGEIDETAPIFRTHHTSHMDWLSDGGYTYRVDDETIPENGDPRVRV